MNVIPVLDLLDGQVVHAKLGDRKNYNPVISSLCNSSAPLDVLEGLLSLYRFNTCYIADLNAIQNTNSNFHLIEEIIQQYPDIQLWVDGGYRDTNDVEKISAAGARVVLGSESINGLEHYQALSGASNHQEILSLDFKKQLFHGPVGLLENPEIWPDEVIVMTLSHVGSNIGPAFDQLQLLKNAAPHSKVYAAGGVRSISDLHQLATIGISGALVASALHAGTITKSELVSLVR